MDAGHRWIGRESLLPGKMRSSSFVVDLAQERDRHRAGADFRNAVTSEAPQLEVPEGCDAARVMAMCVRIVANVVVWLLAAGHSHAALVCALALCALAPDGRRSPSGS